MKKFRTKFVRESIFEIKRLLAKEFSKRVEERKARLAPPTENVVVNRYPGKKPKAHIIANLKGMSYTWRSCCSWHFATTTAVAEIMTLEELRMADIQLCTGGCFSKKFVEEFRTTKAPETPPFTAG